MTATATATAVAAETAAAAETAPFEFSHEITGEFAPQPGDDAKTAKKRVACKNKLDLLAKKARAEMRRVSKAGPDACTDEQSNRQQAYLDEYEARCELMAGAAAPPAAVVAAPARPIPAVRIPAATTPLAPLAGPDGGPIDIYLAELFRAKLAGALGAGYNAAQSREVATNQVIGYLNRGMVHVTQSSAGIWYLTSSADSDSFTLHSKRLKDEEFTYMLGAQGPLPEAAAEGMSKLDRRAFENRPWVHTWIRHAQRRQARSIVYEPPRSVEPAADGTLRYVASSTNDFNIWSGAAIPPESVTGPAAAVDPQAYRRFVAAIGDIFSTHSPEERAYLLNYLAHTIQRPGTLPGTAVVFRGEEGSGKGWIVQVLARILGSAYMNHAKTLEGVTGRFASTWGKSICFLDEIVWCGDMGPQEILKKVVSEERLTIERKYMDPILVANVAHTFLATNHDQAIFAGTSARRWAMFRTTSNGGTPRDLTEFFSVEAVRSIAAGLYSRDISEYEPRRIPHSEELGEQKLRSLRGVDKYLHTLISAEHWQSSNKKTHLYDAYAATAGKHALAITIFYRDLGKRIEYKTVRKGAGGSGGNFIQFPPLAEVKRQFAKYLAISPEQLDEQQKAETAPAPAPAPAPALAGGPGALLDVVCRLWQGRAAAPVPLPRRPRPPVATAEEVEEELDNLLDTLPAVQTTTAQRVADMIATLGQAY